MIDIAQALEVTVGMHDGARRDDFVIRVMAQPQGQQSSARLDMRSRSRVGQGDLGANAARIGQFLQQVKERLTGTST
jgi:uncharacterized protein HemY